MSDSFAICKSNTSFYKDLYGTVYNLLYCRTNKKPKGVTLLSFNEISVLLWCNVQIFDSTLLVNTAEQISVANILWTTGFKSHIIAMNHSSHSSHEGNESVKILREQKWVYYTLCHNIFFWKCVTIYKKKILKVYFYRWVVEREGIESQISELAINIS